MFGNPLFPFVMLFRLLEQSSRRALDRHANDLGVQCILERHEGVHLGR